MLHPIQLADIIEDFESFANKFYKSKSVLIFIGWLKSVNIVSSDKTSVEILEEYNDWQSEKDYDNFPLSACIHWLNISGYIQEDIVNGRYTDY